jgi:heat shock protein HtpX
MSVTATDTTEPLLVYNRIDSNRRTTRRLLTAFVIALLPVASLAAFFIFPLLYFMVFAPNPGLAAQRQPALLALYAGVFLLSMVLVVLILAAVVDRLVSDYSASFILRLARARQVGSTEEPELVQLIENLCIGTGLPTPNIHVIESAAPNAFAVGRTPNDASLVVTRGLLRLLDHRELTGVIAHELSHIGNHDVELSVTLAAFIRTLVVPLKLVSVPLRAAAGLPSPLGMIVIAAAAVVLFGSGWLLLLVELLAGFVYMIQFYLPGGLGWWWEVYAKALPVYAILGAPVAALIVRQAVSHRRALLADADAAMVTRDPEGLALALVKTAAATRDELLMEESDAHLCLVDPTPNSWLHVAFPSHPQLDERVDVLGRMGAGISASTIAAARAAAATFMMSVHNEEQDESRDKVAPQSEPADPSGFEGLTRLYERADETSRVLALLGDQDHIRVKGREGDFVRISAEDGTEGYVLRPLPSART